MRLTTDQREAIDRVYEMRLAGRRRCVERLVEASNRVEQLIEDGVHDEALLRETQAVQHAAMEERVLTRLLSDEIMALLSPIQREKLQAIRRGHIVD